MNEHLAWQIAVTRPVILAGVIVLVGLLVNGAASLLKPDMEQYKSRVCWWIVSLLLIGGHIFAFIYHHDFSHWILSAFYGFWVGALATGMLYAGVYKVLHVKAVKSFIALSVIGFYLAANHTPIESAMINWLSSMHH